jgi:DNA mismatch repair ATPase MutS
MCTTKKAMTTAEYQQLWHFLKNYPSIKRHYPHHLLIFKIGNLYFCFGKDAVTISRILGAELTNRSIETPDWHTPSVISYNNINEAIETLHEHGFWVKVFSKGCPPPEERPAFGGLFFFVPMTGAR